MLCSYIPGVSRHLILPVLLAACCLHSLAPAQEPSPRNARRSASPVALALDANGDGDIDPAEIRKAPQAIAKLDRNGDGQITRDELRGASSPAPTTPTAPATAPAVAAPKNPPNILVIVADDLGWNGVGFHDAKAPTPNLDRLAGDGMELGRFYTYPVCSPARAAFLTGMMPLRYGIADALGPRQAGIPANVTTLAEILRGAGYQTSLVGKWHLGSGRSPQSCGFEHFHGFLGPQIDYFKHTNPRGEADWQHDGKPLEETGYSTDLIANETIRQLRARNPQKPCFNVVTFNAPHVPLAAPEELMAKHKNDVYMAAIDAMDAAIGRILTALDECGMRDNTLVLFFSDNGAGQRFSSNTPLSGGKDTVREGGIRTPCVIRWPGKIGPHGKNDHPIAAQDLLPTLCAAAGITLPASLHTDGSNQWPAVLSGKAAPREPFLIASHDTALIDGEWKLIAWENGKNSLFHLTADISESTDESAKQPDLTNKLIQKLNALKQGLPAAPERRAARPPQSQRTKP